MNKKTISVYFIITISTVIFLYLIFSRKNNDSSSINENESSFLKETNITTSDDSDSYPFKDEDSHSSEEIEIISPPHEEKGVIPSSPKDISSSFAKNKEVTKDISSSFVKDKIEAQKINNVTINDKYIDKLNIDNGVECLRQIGKGLKKEQYINILIALKVYSTFRTSWLDLNEKATNIQLNKARSDSFMSSINTIVFLQENGINKCLNVLEQEYVFIYSLLVTFVARFYDTEINENIEEYFKEPFASAKKQAEDMCSDNLKEKLNKTTITILNARKKREWKISDFVWVRICLYLDNLTKLYNLKKKKIQYSKT
ncbi:uncharacterized protein VNE69_05204 [Vairimorpha necatrix]|uniref:Plasmodium RESA N-terminal domain-containing protein n=1 Tax=Vairimorpha necatrix TaxID=6039 RepID=A0AAX4JCD6_9MICR